MSQDFYQNYLFKGTQRGQSPLYRIVPLQSHLKQMTTVNLIFLTY